MNLIIKLQKLPNTDIFSINGLSYLKVLISLQKVDIDGAELNDSTEKTQFLEGTKRWFIKWIVGKVVFIVIHIELCL